MLRGKLLYAQDDVIRNKAYIDWLIDEAKNQGIQLELSILGNPLETCDFVINRTRNYEIALKYELSRIPVFNNSTCTLLGNNKLAGYRFVQNLGIEYPRVYLDKVCDDLPESLIRKPNGGHGGEDVMLVSKEEYLVGKEGRRHIDQYLYQEYISDQKGDVRYYIINNQIIHSIIRSPLEGQILSNYSKGGNIRVYVPSNKELDVVSRILGNIHMDFAGIDFIVSKDGKAMFNEFEDVVGSRMLSALGINNTTHLFIKHIKESLN